MNFNLDYRDYGRREETQYGESRWEYEWREDHVYRYFGARITNEGYSDVSLFPGETEVKPGDDIYIVYVSYDSGDSFGRENGCRTHLWAFSNSAKAYRLVEAIRKDAAANPNFNYEGKPLEFEGVPINTNEWKGYFEHFNYADVEAVVVKN